MSKRKRDEDHQVGYSLKEPTSKDLRAQKKYLEGILKRGKQLLWQALKLARGFERQKLGRRQKVAKAAKNDDDSKRLVAEVSALKVCLLQPVVNPDEAYRIWQALDMYSTVELHLYKTLLKTKSIASHPAFPTYIQIRLEEKAKPYDLAQANVQARLFNSQPVKKAMGDSISNIRHSLGLDDMPRAKKKRIRKQDYEREQTKTSQGGEKPSNAHGNGSEHPADLDSEASPRFEAQRPEIDEAGCSEDSDYDEFKSRLVGSSDGCSYGDGRSVDYQELRVKSTGVPIRELSLSPSPEVTDSSVATDSPPPPSRKARASEQSLSDAKATTFLPSLTMGGYWSGSEQASEAEGPLGGQPKKNRRGQRERRMIAEKKFGQNAKHLKKQDPVLNRDRGWNARKGAEETDEFGRMKRWRGRGGSTSVAQATLTTRQGAAASSGANSDPVGPTRGTGKGKAEGSLHPSWQAAKKAKEQKQTATFQGKKVTFD
ncbi:MAG: hypothetical protein Q9166_005613 [cf. Caloplaca sp. 2 TL-2023]